MKQLLELIKSNWLFVMLGLLVVIFAVIGIVRNMPVKDENSTKTSQTQQSSSSSKEETEDEKNYRKAKLALDHPYSEASQSDKDAATPNVTIAMDFITSHNNIDDMKGSLENHLYMSENPMIQTVWIAIHSNGYSYDSSQLEVLKSDNSDVVQLLMVFKKDGANKVYFTANYNTTVNQIQVTRYFGGPIGATYG